MKSVQFGLMLLMSLTLAACGSSNSGSGSGPESVDLEVSDQSKTQSVDKDGNCSFQFVADYNSVLMEGKTLDAFSNGSDTDFRKHATSTSKACAQFNSRHSNVTCKAKADYETKEINSSEIKKLCDTVNEMLKPKAPTEKPKEKEKEKVVEAPKNPSVNQDGSCTDAFIKDYNQVNESHRKVALQMTAEPFNEKAERFLREMDTSCNSFFKTHGNASCTALQNGYKKTTVDTAPMKKVCDSGKDLLKSIDDAKTGKTTVKPPQVNALPDLEF